MTGTRVDILDASTREVVGRCYGPTLAGRCPQLDPKGNPPCAGHRIVALGGGPEMWLRWIPPSARRCPLAWDQDVGTVESAQG